MHGLNSKEHTPQDLPLPLLGIALHNAATLGVVLLDAHREDIVSALHTSPSALHFASWRFKYLDAKFLINLVLNGQTVAIPTETPSYVVSSHVRVTRYGILHEHKRAVSTIRAPP